MTSRVSLRRRLSALVVITAILTSAQEFGLMILFALVPSP